MTNKQQPNPKTSCGCCEGIEVITPEATANRPGLGALAYRVGTHATFLETMKARLSGLWLEVPRQEPAPDGLPRFDRIYPLRGLTTREINDPSIALLDAWATVADALTFYQERIANEGYLGTATERRSVLDLARLIGYTPRPGVAATVYLAYTVDDSFEGEVTIIPGARSQSVPGPGELPQSFETVEPLLARADWNVLRPRMTRPQTKKTINQGDGDGKRLYLKGVGVNLQPNDPLIIEFGGELDRRLVRVKEVEPDAAAGHTLITFQDWLGVAAPRITASPEAISLETRSDLADLVTRYLGEEADRIGLSRAGKTFENVSGQLEDLLRQLAEDAPFPALAERLNMEVLPILSDALRKAEGNPQATKLRPWLENLIDELTDVATGAFTRRAESLALEFTLPAPVNDGKAVDGRAKIAARDQGDQFVDVVAGLTRPASVPPANALQLKRNLNVDFDSKADTGIQLASAFREDIRELLPAAVAGTKVSSEVGIKVYALRATAALFGHDAPPQPEPVPDTPFYTLSADSTIANTWGDSLLERVGITVALDAVYDQVTPGGLIAIDHPSEEGSRAIQIRTVTRNQPTTLEAVGVATKVSVLTLEEEWLDQEGRSNPIFDPSFLRGSTVYAQSEELPLAEEPVDDPICGSNDASDPNALIELDDLYSGLQAGRWLIVSGERADIQIPDPDDPARTIPVTGIRSSELVMLAEVLQTTPEAEPPGSTSAGYYGSGYYGYGFDPTPAPGEKIHTFIRLAKRLEYCYRRDTVAIHANVVKATHGETRAEVLGSGDGTQPFQNFTLRQPPLTYVPSPTPAGAESTLKVFVNDLQWRETDALAELGPAERKFVTRTDDDGKTTVIFGNGEHGARLPTGTENIRAVYRNGIGKAGNVKAEQVSQLVTRPLGVKEVVNPLRASGGADRESRDQARKNAPGAVTALDRLVSTQDYADFARTFAGIGKSASVRLTDGRRELVHLTIAGIDDIPIDESSDLFRNLTLALRRFGDPFQPFKVETRELIFMVISARIRILPDYLWEPVVSAVRARLLDAFSFERRELAQDVALSEVISVIQSVNGVEYVDVDLLRGIPEKIADAENPGRRRLLTPAEIVAKVNEPLVDAQGRVISEPLSRLTVNPAGFDAGTLRPAQLAYLTPLVPATLSLNQI
jgi:hypothetical protein